MSLILHVHLIWLIVLTKFVNLTGTTLPSTCCTFSLSQRRPVTSDILQGSVLSARLFTMYTYHIALIFNKHKLEYHSYTDDTQVYLHCDNNVATLRHAVHQLENCVFDICDWMRRNALKLNEDKNNMLFFVRRII